MKIVITIPAYNEAETIGRVIKEIPRDCADNVKVLVINDGSRDRTAEAARQAGADKIISHKTNLGFIAHTRYSRGEISAGRQDRSRCLARGGNQGRSGLIQPSDRVLRPSRGANHNRDGCRKRAAEKSRAEILERGDQCGKRGL